MTIFRNIAAVILGAIVGGIVNISLIMIGSTIVPPPEGVDVTSSESMAAAMDLFEPQHFLFPFVAHAVGTFAGAVVAMFVGASYQDKLAYIVGTLFLLGGITNAFMIPAPMWFIVLDLIFAYLPAAWLGIKVALQMQPTVSSGAQA